jgi:hypothetical protein
MTARLLDTGSHGPYASRRIGHGLSGADGCRAGAERAVLEGGTGPGRVGGDEDPSPCLQVYGDARPPDEASRTGAGMRCRMGSRTSHTARRAPPPGTRTGS